MQEEMQQQPAQRSREWFQKRHKRWTASTIDKLMSEQGVPDKANQVFKWGAAAKTSLFAMFYRRLIDVIEKEIYPTFAMERGIELEPLAIERFGELYPEYNLIPSEELVDTGFVLFPDNDGTREWEEGYKGENASAGASPDQLIIVAREELRLAVVSGIETKARGEGASLSHAYSQFDEKHPDWWQVIAQMHSVGAKFWYYLNYDDEKPAPWDLLVKRVEKSDIHVAKMCQKIKDADALIADYLERCKGIETMMPHEADILLTGIYCEIRDLKEKW